MKLKAFAGIKLTVNPFANDKFFTLPNWKSLQTTILNSMKMAKSHLKRAENTGKR